MKLCGPPELRVKRVSLRTSQCVPEQAAVASCFPCCSVTASFAVLGQERNTKRASYPQLHKKGPAAKEVWGGRDQDNRKRGGGGGEDETERGRQKRGQCNYKRGRMISLVQSMGNWGGSVLSCLTIIMWPWEVHGTSLCDLAILPWNGN